MITNAVVLNTWLSIGSLRISFDGLQVTYYDEAGNEIRHCSMVAYYKVE